jgi:hypothetical protein
MVSCNICSNVSSCSHATWQSFHFLQGDIYYQKNSNQNKNKAKHYDQDFFLKKENKCSTKKLAKKKIQQKIQQTNKRKQVFHKKTSKQKTDLKNQQKKKGKKKKILIFFLARPKVSKLRISKRITFLCK